MSTNVRLYLSHDIRNTYNSQFWLENAKLLPSFMHHYNIEITHVFSCINICGVPRMLFEHKADRPSVQTSSEGPGKC